MLFDIISDPSSPFNYAVSISLLASYNFLQFLALSEREWSLLVYILLINLLTAAC